MPRTAKSAPADLRRDRHAPSPAPPARVFERRLRRGGHLARAAVRLVGVAFAVWVVLNHGWLWLLAALALIFVVAFIVEWLIHDGPHIDVAALIEEALRDAEPNRVRCPACGREHPAGHSGACPRCGHAGPRALLPQDGRPGTTNTPRS